MLMNHFLSRHSRLYFALIVIAFAGIMLLTGARVQAKIESQSRVDQNNPHHLPSELNPRVPRAEEEVAISNEAANEGVTIDVLHASALSNGSLESHPIYDYTTGTTN